MPDGHARDERFRERLTHRSEEAIGDVADALLENPLFDAALQAAVGARDRAVAARRTALGAADVASARDVDRLERRLRSLADRLEELENAIDHLGREVAGVRDREGPADRETTPTSTDSQSRPKLYP